jgi:phenylacetate-CoA ligase
LVFRYAPISVYNKKEISIKIPIIEIINELNQFNPEMIIAYPGVFISLIKYKKEGLLKINPKKIYLTGEVLTDENLKLIKENFTADIYNLYNCSECMNMAVRKNFGKFKLFNNLNHVEILDENNKPVPKGQIGKVVITNFINFSQPLIRYELGDLAVSSANENEELSFEGIIGRKYRPIIFKNNIGESVEIFTLTFYEIIAKSIEVVKAQILIGNNYFKVNLVCDDIYLLNCELNVIKYLKKINSDESITFEIERLDDILPENNGKIPLIKFLDNYEEIPNIPYNIVVTENTNTVLN